VNDLTFSVASGSGRLLLTGFNGAGKSSIFRVLGGLWSSSGGSITKPGGGGSGGSSGSGSGGGHGLATDVFYLPQKPYNVVGSLREQLCYPATTTTTTTITDEQLLLLLQKVDLGYLWQRRGDVNVDWHSELSLGEMQRFSIARLFFHKPKFAILDECTSATPQSVEKLLYHECDRLGIAYITICHRPQLREYHDVNLELQGEGRWQLKQLPPSSNSGGGSSDVVASDDSGGGSSGSAAVKSPSASSSNDSSSGGGGGRRQRSAISKLATLAKILLPPTAPTLLLLCSTLGARTVLGHWNGAVMADLLRATINRDRTAFWRCTVVNVLQDLITAAVDESVTLVGARLSEQWHEILAKRTSKLLFKNNNYYHVTDDVSDWDERVSSEIFDTTTHLSSLVSTAITPTADAAFFAAQLLKTVGWTDVAAMGAYVAVVTVVTRLTAPNYERLNTQERQLEARFRSVHTRVVHNAESIAFFDGGAKEKTLANEALVRLVNHQQRLRATTAAADVVTHSVSRDYGSYSSYVCAPVVLSYWLQLRYALQQQDLTATVYISTAVDRSLSAFGKLSSVADALVSLLGSSGRIFELLDALEERGRIASGTAVARTTKTTGMVTVGDCVAMDAVTIVTPTRRVLAEKVTFSAARGESMAVVGPDGTGKTAVFRVLAGLWPPRGGRVTRPESLFLVPQRPYSVPGSLAAQVTYPRPYSKKDDEEKVMAALEKSGVAYLATRFEAGLDEVKRWEDTLSLGEQQRVGFSRVYFHEPSFAVLDECSDAISQDAEANLFKTLAEMGVTCVTISKRLELPQFHQQQLALGADNAQRWSLREL